MQKKFKINLSYVSLCLYLVLALRSLDLIPWKIEQSAWLFLVILETLTILGCSLAVALLSIKPIIIRKPLPAASEPISLIEGSKWWWFNHVFILEWVSMFLIAANSLEININILLFLFVFRQVVFNFLMLKIRASLRKLNSKEN